MYRCLWGTWFLSQRSDMLRSQLRRRRRHVFTPQWQLMLVSCSPVPNAWGQTAAKPRSFLVPWPPISRSARLPLVLFRSQGRSRCEISVMSIEVAFMRVHARSCDLTVAPPIVCVCNNNRQEYSNDTEKCRPWR